MTGRQPNEIKESKEEEVGGIGEKEWSLIETLESHCTQLGSLIPYH